MKRFSLLLIVVALVFGAWKAYDNIYFRKDKQPIAIKCDYMAYACGDCYPQWHIDSGFAMEKGLRALIGKDIYVERNGIALEELISDSTGNCMICYDFYLTGSLKKTLSNKYKFEVDSCQMKLRTSDCCK